MNDILCNNFTHRHEDLNIYIFVEMFFLSTNPLFFISFNIDNHDQFRLIICLIRFQYKRDKACSSFSVY